MPIRFRFDAMCIPAFDVQAGAGNTEGVPLPFAIITDVQVRFGVEPDDAVRPTDLLERLQIVRLGHTGTTISSCQQSRSKPCVSFGMKSVRTRTVPSTNDNASLFVVGRMSVANRH